MLVNEGFPAVVGAVKLALIQQISYFFGNTRLHVRFSTQRTIGRLYLPIVYTRLAKQSFARVTHDHIFDNIGTDWTEVLLDHFGVVAMSKVQRQLFQFFGLFGNFDLFFNI